MIYLQLSTGQSPAECQYFAKQIWQKMLQEAQQYHLVIDVISETPSKYGLLSAIVAVSGSRVDEWAMRWLGTLQWVCQSPIRPNHLRKNWFIAVAKLPEMPVLADDGAVRFETCRASGTGGQHVNKTDSAVRAIHLATGMAVRVESERSQHTNKKRALELLAIKLVEQHQNALSEHAANRHTQLYQLERGNAVRVFHGLDFVEKYSRFKSK